MKDATAILARSEGDDDTITTTRPNDKGGRNSIIPVIPRAARTIPLLSTDDASVAKRPYKKTRENDRTTVGKHIPRPTRRIALLGLQIGTHQRFPKLLTHHHHLIPSHVQNHTVYPKSDKVSLAS
jgi:hypothetical protein